MRQTGLALAAILAFGPFAANADVITFNGTAAEGRCSFVSAPYSEAGYTVAPTGGTNFFCDNDNSAFPGLATLDDDSLEFNSEDSSVTLTRDDGSLFDLLSVITGSLGRASFDDGNFIFTGFFGAGGSISETVLALGFGMLPSTHNFSGFTGLSSVVVSTSDGFFPVMDDITLAATSVPEPGTLALLGIGLFGAGLARRHRKA